MAEAVYILCALTSAICALLLFRGHQRTKTQLLLWSAICFLGFALNNAILFVDVVVVPTHDLSVIRLLPAVIGVGALLYGLVKEAT